MQSMDACDAGKVRGPRMQNMLKNAKAPAQPKPRKRSPQQPVKSGGGEFTGERGHQRRFEQLLDDAVLGPPKKR